MLLVKTKLAPSSIHGLGLFADENILKGTLIWKWVDGFDLVYTTEQIELFPEEAKSYIHFHAWEEGGKFFQCGDNDRFANHSENPNCVSDGVRDFAVRDINKGEEIIYNYWEFHRGKNL